MISMDDTHTHIYILYISLICMNIVYIYIDYEKSNFPQNVEIKAQNVEIKGIIVTPQIMHVMGILQLQVLASECSLHQRRARHLKHQQPGSSFPSNLLTRESRPEKDPNRMWAVSSKSSTSITPGLPHPPFSICWMHVTQTHYLETTLNRMNHKPQPFASCT